MDTWKLWLHPWVSQRSRISLPSAGGADPPQHCRRHTGAGGVLWHHVAVPSLGSSWRNVCSPLQQRLRKHQMTELAWARHPRSMWQ